MKCLVPECSREAIARGLCMSCYKAAYYQIRKGVVSWKELEKLGKVLPSRPGRRSRRYSYFLDGSPEPQRK